MKLKFKNFLLNENKTYLSERIGNILSAVSDMTDEGANMGTRQKVKFAEKIVALIRRILHSNWPSSEEKTLERLQKVAFNIMRSIDPPNEKEQVDLESIMPAVEQELQDILAGLGTTVNRLGDTEDIETPENLPPGEPAPESQPQQPQVPQEPGMPGASELGAPPPPPPGAGQPPPPTAGPAAAPVPPI